MRDSKGVSGWIFGVIVACLSLWDAQNANAADKILRIHFVNVGFGDAILIESPDSRHVLVDAGPQEYSQELLRHLSAAGIKTIHAAVITHPHRNHFEGFFSLLESMPIERLYINGQPQEEEGYDKLLEEFRKPKIPVEILHEGDHLDLGNSPIRIMILNPRDLKGSTNDNALVVWLRYQKTSFLLSSDIGVNQQERIFAQYPEALQSSCIQIPHHGWDVSSFLKNAPAETIFVVSTGVDTRHPQAPPNLESLPGRLLRTDRDGTIILESDGEKLQVIRP